MSNISLPTLTDVISDALRTDIRRGALRPGVRVHPREVAERFGVSAMPVREALRRLEAEGLVSFDKNRRILVNRLSVGEMREVAAIRAELEALALLHAAPRLRDDATALASLDQLVDRMDEERDPDNWRSINEAFHRELYHASGMPRLEALIASVTSSIGPYIRLYVRTGSHLDHAQREHRMILEQIRAGQADAAATLLRAHIAYARDRVEEALADRESPEPR